MAGGLLEHSGLVTKTKAMRARLLGADDYTAIRSEERRVGKECLS